MIELAMNTMTADSRMGSQSAARKCIGGLFLSNWNGRIMCEAILFRGEGQARG
jgi:mevalonate pyrophosphate decarboxylase